MARRPGASLVKRPSDPPAGAGTTFRLNLLDVVGEALCLRPIDDKRSMRYELVRGFGQRVALFSLGLQGELARVECSAGEWRVLKRRRLGWELIVENSDGYVVGWYSGRRWRTGGTIFLRSGPQLDLLKSKIGRWTLRTVDRQESVMRMHGRISPLEVELLSPATRLADAPIAALTACSIPLIDEQLTPRLPAGS